MESKVKEIECMSGVRTEHGLRAIVGRWKTTCHRMCAMLYRCSLLDSVDTPKYGAVLPIYFNRNYASAYFEHYTKPFAQTLMGLNNLQICT